MKNNKQYIIDVRGEDLIWENDKPFFDAYYDCSKILFYFYGWKSIREERFEIETNNYSLTNAISYIKFIDNKKTILDKMSNVAMDEFKKYKNAISPLEKEHYYIDKLNLLSGIHFLSDTYPRIVGTGDKEKQCYAEFLIGTIIINKMYEKIMKEWK